MRKLSEILRIATQFHTLWVEEETGIFMCYALEIAEQKEAITKEESIRAQQACMKLVRSIDKTMFTLRGSLVAKFNLNPLNTHTVYLVYEAWIDKLESQGK